VAGQVTAHDVSLLSHCGCGALELDHTTRTANSLAPLLCREMSTRWRCTPRATTCCPGASTDTWL
jgi:hypothetical protein